MEEGGTKDVRWEVKPSADDQGLTFSDTSMLWYVSRLGMQIITYNELLKTGL